MQYLVCLRLCLLFSLLVLLFFLRWKKYISELCAGDRNKSQCTDNETVPKVLKSEVEKAIRRMKYRKVICLDDISIEVLEVLEECGIEKITDQCNGVYNKRDLH